MTFVIFIIVAIVAISIIQIRNQNARKKDAIAIFGSLPDFTLTEMYAPTKASGVTIALDGQRNKICLLTNGVKQRVPFIYNAGDIVASELQIDNDTVQKHSTGSAIGRAVVGGVLTGGIGAIIGGVTGKVTNKEYANSIDLKITLNDTVHPMVKINFLSDKTSTKSFDYKSAYGDAEKWQALLTVLIKKAELTRASTPNIIQLAEPSSSTTSELLKLKELFDQGILSEAEFAQAKQKMLA